ncbi:glycerol uptake facilitator protein [Saonia flava]|uniref:Glycerol uptake facilitator protein n=1 Tax=Saonia flava TaxID=523696 RepID=A0A846R076_9FLAO|nr:MIP/aquaporin family protein [Saonia flava]NJB71833.1 glycerol uptake facilitator protein [Saonia flava]
MTPFVAEIIGTALLLTLGCGVVANTVLQKTFGNGGGWIVITTGWAMAVYMGVVVAAPYSGAHINPAVTIGLAVAGKFSWSLVGPYILAQFIGAMIGAFLVWITHKPHFDCTVDGDTKKAVFCNKPAIPHLFSNIMTEIIGTFILVFSVLYFTDATIEDSGSLVGLGSLGALPVAFVVWGIGLCLGGATGYAINPARDLGPRIVHALLPIKEKASSDWGYSWIPVVGPVLGAVFAALLMLGLS